MSEEFTTAASLRVEVEQSSLQSARSEIEELTADPITVETDMGSRPGSAMGGLQTDGGMMAGIADPMESQAADLGEIADAWDDNTPLNERRNTLLEELVEAERSGDQGGASMGGMLGGGLLIGGLVGALGISKLISFLDGFDWPDMPDPPSIDIPSEIPVDAPSDIPVGAPSSIPIDAPNPDWVPLDAPNPDWVPIGVPKPDWLPIGVDVPDPLDVDVPDPLGVDVPESIPVDAPSEIPVDVPELAIPQPDWWPSDSGTGTGTGTGSNIDTPADIGTGTGDSNDITDYDHTSETLDSPYEDSSATYSNEGQTTDADYDPSEQSTSSPVPDAVSQNKGLLVGGTLALTGLGIAAANPVPGPSDAVGASTIAKGAGIAGTAAIFSGSAAAEGDGGNATASQDVYQDNETQTGTSTSESTATGSSSGNSARNRSTQAKIDYSPTYKLPTKRLEKQMRKDRRELERRIDKLEKQITRGS